MDQQGDAGMAVSQERAAGSGRRGLLAAVLAAGVWMAWLGWDNTYYYNRAIDQWQGPYRAWQVIGCVATLAVVTVVLTLRWNARFVLGGITLGFWAPYTVWAFMHDDSGLWGVGSVLVLVGMGLGTLLVGGSTELIRYWVTRAQTR